MRFYFSVRGDRITAREDYSFVEGNRQVYEAVFEFDEEWKDEGSKDRFDRMCVVYNNGIKALPVPITKNEDGVWMCLLPLLTNGSAKVGVVGLDGEEDSICPRISTNWANVNVNKGAANDDTAVDIDSTVAEIWEQYYLQMAEKAEAAEEAQSKAESFSERANTSALDALGYKDETEMLRNEALGFSDSARVIAENMQKDAEEILKKAETYRDEANTYALSTMDSADSIKNLSVEAAEGDTAGVIKTETEDGIKLRFTLPKGEDGKDGYTPKKGVDYFTPEDIEELGIPVVDSELSTDSENAVQNKVVANKFNDTDSTIRSIQSDINIAFQEISSNDTEIKELKPQIETALSESGQAYSLASQALSKSDENSASIQVLQLEKADIVYVDEKIGDIDAALLEIIEIQESLMIPDGDEVAY